MSYAEFVEWGAFASIHPFGDDRIDLHFAHLCSVVATVMGTKHIPTARFLLNDRVEEAEQEPEEGQPQSAAASADDISKAFGGARVIHIKRKPPTEVNVGSDGAVAVRSDEEGARE